ncbi:MAG: carbohydrate ABC transporter permease [Roseburia sp.]|nr:carbohydrate ABC transporter permease [Roseburia sp.]
MKRETLYRGKRSYHDKIFHVVDTAILLVLFVVFAWPLWFVLIASFSSSSAVMTGKVILLPRDFTLEGYTELLQYTQLWRGYANTIFYAGVGTLVNMLMTICCAYPLSNKQFLPRKIILYFCMVTMYVSGGLIPTYLVVKSLGILSTRWAMIIPGALSFYNALIVRAYFMNSIPVELQEAATLDGANAAQYLMKVVLQLSKPVLAVVSLYYFVGHWNDYYTALIYIYDKELYPLQTVLKNLLMDVKSTTDILTMDPKELAALLERQQIMKYSSIIVAMIPVLVIYPFIQKYFVKGVMIGAVKG